jgi:hypothetical protein
MAATVSRTSVEVTIAVDLDPADQWERPKRYTRTVRYRVDSIVARAYRSDGEELSSVSYTLAGPRVLVNGTDGDRQYEKGLRVEEVGFPDTQLPGLLSTYVYRALDEAPVPMLGQSG